MFATDDVVRVGDVVETEAVRHARRARQDLRARKGVAATGEGARTAGQGCAHWQTPSFVLGLCSSQIGNSIPCALRARDRQPVRPLRRRGSCVWGGYPRGKLATGERSA